MKKFLLSMLLLIVGIPSFAQKGQIELSLYGGLLSYSKTENSYYGTFSSGFERNDLNRTSYLLSAGIGIDLSISKNWKIGGGYSFRYLGDVDGSHAIFARISYVIP